MQAEACKFAGQRRVEVRAPKQTGKTNRGSRAGVDESLEGEPDRAAVYAEKNKIECLVLCDPTFKVYEAYDLLEGQPSQIVFDASDELLKCELEAGRELQNSRHGTERAAVDSPWQLPGEFVVDKNGIIRLAYRYQYCEDWPNPLVLIAGIKEAIWET